MALVSSRRTYVALIVFLLLLIAANYFNWFSGLKFFLRGVFTPIFTNANQLGVKIGDNYQFFTNKSQFFDSYNQCLSSAQNKEATDATNKLLEEENIELKKQLTFVRRTTYKTLTVSVVGRNADSIEKTIIINAGLNQGIKVGFPITAGDGILVGSVTKVEDELSVVRLLSDNQSKVLVTLLNKERSLGVVEAGFGTSIRMGFIPRNEVVMIGDQIVTSGQEVKIPKGLLIGKVSSIENEAYQPFQQATLEPATNLEKLIDVTVIFSF
jgi:rod shape-determining protein MreC